MNHPNDVAEALRLAELYELAILDTHPEDGFEAVVDLGVSAFGCSSCIVSFVDSERQWIKARRGMDAAETPRDISICTHTIKKDEPMVINDCREDPRFKDNPLVTGSPWIRAYLGIPIKTPSGAKVGSFCLIDNLPRPWTEADIRMAQAMASLVETALHERRKESALHTPAAVPIARAGRASLRAESHLYGSWRRAADTPWVTLSPNLEQWLCLTESSEVSWDWFCNAINPHKRDAVKAARLQANGRAFEYEVTLPNGQALLLQERVYRSEQADPADHAPWTVGLIRKLPHRDVPAPLPEQSADPLEDLKGNPPIFILESSAGRMHLDLHFRITAIGQLQDTELQRSKQAVHLLDMVYEEDRETLLSTLQTSADSRLKGRAFARLRIQDERPVWARFLIEPSPLALESSRRTLQLVYTKMVNESVMLERNLLDQSLLSMTEKISDLGTWFYHVDSGTLRISQQFRRLCKAEATRLNTIFELTELLTKLAGENLSALMIDCINSRQAKTVEFECRTDAAPNKRWFKLTLQPIVKGVQGSVGLYGCLENITQVKQTSKILEGQHGFVKRLLAQFTQGMLELNEQLEVSGMDSAAKHALLGKDEQFQYNTPAHQLLKISPDALLMAKTQATRLGTATPIEHALPDQDVMLKIIMMRTESGYALLLTDESKSSRTNRDLHMLASAVEQINEVIMVTNDLAANSTDFKVVYLNSAFENVTGQSLARWIGRNPYHLIADRLPLRDFRRILVSLLKREPLNLHTHYETDDSQTIPCEILVSPFVDKQTGTPWSLIVFRPAAG
ncbi:MAG TPA: GAF domain-containing protein [Limnobacter sp.]|nr:GAF domain-containing protein [Limnobacter sp.]